MDKNLISSGVTRREALRQGAGIVGGVLAGGVGAGTHLPAIAAQAEPKASRVHEYAGMRGFNYQPSWGSNDISIWCHFNDDLFSRELDLGKQHFPGIQVLRIWFSPNAWLEDRKGFLEAAGRAMAMMAQRNLKMLPVYFNGWHSYPDFGGFCNLQLRQHKKNHNWALFRQYTRELQKVLTDNGEILMHDVSNEPFNSVTGTDADVGLVRECLGVVAGELHEASPRIPVCVGTQGMSLKDLDWVDPFVDVHAIHPYVLRPGLPKKSQEDRLERFAQLMKRLEELNKPGLVTECCWGSNDDAVRARIVREELSLYQQHRIGFLPHALHHSWVADLHRPRPWQTWGTMYMGFIDPDGSIRPGHEVYNEFC